jgi:hypothetical protein
MTTKLGTKYPDLMKLLSAPIPPNEIEWRPGSTNRDKTRCLALPYLTSRIVMQRLDTVVGPENWQDSYTAAPTQRDGIQAGIGIHLDGRWVWKYDAAEPTGIEPIKGGYSDALKRCAVKWGIGRGLYQFPAIWVACEPAGKSVRLSEDPLPKLRKAAPWYFKAYEKARQTYAQMYREQVAGVDVPAPAPAEKPAPATDAALEARQKAIADRLLGIVDRAVAAGRKTPEELRALINRVSGAQVLREDGELDFETLVPDRCAVLEHLCAKSEERERELAAA